MVQAILISKISFAGIVGSEYFHIICDENSVVINPLERKQALQIIEDDQLILAKPEDYLGQYNSKLGRIYVNADFQSTVNSNPKQKEYIILCWRRVRLRKNQNCTNI